MVFILTEQRKKDVVEAFGLYQEYLRANEAAFPQSAYALATSDWYWDPTRSGCPHDGWLKRFLITEPVEVSCTTDRSVEITIELLGPYHDGVIEFRYPTVYGYQMEARDLEMGHCDWHYDEFRINSSGALIHEIEWCGSKAIAKTLIIASDVEYKWSPLSEGVLHSNKQT